MLENDKMRGIAAPVLTVIVLMTQIAAGSLCKAPSS
jgi:hypothetical protein